MSIGFFIFTNIAQASGSLLTIFSGIRAIFAIGEIFKAYQYKSLLGRAVLMSDKIQTLKSLIYVSSTELFQALPDNLQERKQALKSYYDEKIPEAQTHTCRALTRTRRQNNESSTQFRTRIL